MASHQSTSQRGKRGPALLAAGRRLFARKGYGSTTVEAVARMAGFSKRTLYLYFKNKDDLFITLASEGISILQRSLEEMDIENQTVEELVQETAERYLQFATDHPAYFQMIFAEASPEMVANASPQVRERVAHQERECLGVVALIVDKGIREGAMPPHDPWETAVVFWGTCTGIILLSLGGSQTVFNRRSREELIASALAVLLEGYKVSQPRGKRA